MTALDRLLAPHSVAIAGLSADAAKHGQRVLANMRHLGFDGLIWGINPNRPPVDGVKVYASVDNLPGTPDIIVSAIPADATVALASDAARAGVAFMIIFAGGFAEADDAGRARQHDLKTVTSTSNMRVLGPNSGGVIHPSAGIALSFLTCLDRPAEQIRSGPVGLVTQSGGMGSYVHNLAAGMGDGLAASISTGNEADLGVADGIVALTEMAEVKAIAVILETVRDGEAFSDAVKYANDAGKQVVVTRIGSSARGQRLMGTHTGAMARPERVLDGVLDALGVSVAATPAEMFEIASVVARSRRPLGRRVGVVTHSGGVAILLSDLAADTSIELPPPSADLRRSLEPLLQHGAVDNPLDMGGIIGGPHRFGEVVGEVARSGDVDAVLAVSSAHPPAHSNERVASLLALGDSVPVVHLWMAGDVAAPALITLRSAGAAVTEEPRAAIKALDALVGSPPSRGRTSSAPPDAVPRKRITESEGKRIVARWGLEIPTGAEAANASSAVTVAERIGYPVVVKLSSREVVHKTELGGVVLDVADAAELRRAFSDVQAATPEGMRFEGALIEQYVVGPVGIVGTTRDEVFGPMVLVGLGGVVAEAIDDARMAPAPVSIDGALRMIRQLAGLSLLTKPRTTTEADLEGLARIIMTVSQRMITNTWIQSLDLNPIVWSGSAWVALDAAFDVR